MADDDQPATKGELRATNTDLRAAMDGLRATTDELSTKLTSVGSKLDDFILEMRSTRTGVQQSGTVIPEGTVVIESGSFFAHASRAIARHKGQRVKIITPAEHSTRIPRARCTVKKVL